ncbi:MAG TPA: LCP family protein [Candidatus Saccharimonadales bacterium]|nr:LCP family protein [Candidatus Saccharimonadales bacterium]
MPISMPQKARLIAVHRANSASRPAQDAVTASRQAKNFPSVGMTLHSYQYDPRDHHGRASGAKAVVKQTGRLRRILKPKRIAKYLAIIVVLAGLFVGGKFLYDAHKLFGGSIFGFLHTTRLKGEDVGRVNILLAGNSSDDAGHNGGQLTDSIMILSIDTQHNKAFILSVPRDLWVNIGDDGHAKINAAYVYGEEQQFSETGYPTGGMGQLEQVIEQNFGIDIDYYGLIDYSALRDAVNSVGGIDITIKSDDPRGLYDPSIDYVTHGPLVSLKNGKAHLNGEQALDLARARGDAYGSYGFDASDFDRTMHQRQMLVALKSKATSLGVLANPAKVTGLADALGNNVKTDMTLSEFHRLYDLIKPINNSAIKSLSLNDANGKNLLASYTAPGGQSALAPAAGLDDFSDIQQFIHQNTSNSPIVQENAAVVVLNGTTASGLASKERTRLLSKDLDVISVGDASGNQATTTIIDNSKGKKPSTKALLEQVFGHHVTTTNPYAGVYNADFIIILGNDQAAQFQANQ